MFVFLILPLVRRSYRTFAHLRLCSSSVLRVGSLIHSDVQGLMFVCLTIEVLQEMTDLAERSFAALAERDRLATVEHGRQDQTQSRVQTPDVTEQPPENGHQMP